MLTRFRDRREAGRVLAQELAAYARRPDVVVLALPRGGVPVAYEVARALGAPLDVFLVRKLGVPGHEELAMGAVATGGVRVLNDQVVRALGIPPDVIDMVAASIAVIRAPLPGTRTGRGVRGRAVIVEYFNRQIPPRIRGIANRVIARFYEREFASEQFVLLETLSGQKITSCKHGAANARQLAQHRKMTRNAESADLSREFAWLLGI